VTMNPRHEIIRDGAVAIDGNKEIVIKYNK
jgi:hypothetical protein